MNSPYILTDIGLPRLHWKTVIAELFTKLKSVLNDGTNEKRDL